MSNVFITMEQDPHPMTFDVRGLHDNGRCREESTKTLRSCFVYLFLPSFNVTFSPNTDTRYLQESPVYLQLQIFSIKRSKTADTASHR
jgi:hypothetical protein